ncbi:hypothetical protein INT46_009916 [Mucor plumbeus]|uniref:Uncharacterized protein n=1 Tax=Mucor plumbeus TaxID=97098 RepID=A0A8H7QTP1_9FUNG|nr:hypothetical protein INT46_009916 [Mucor plumbeus]
MNYFLNKNSVPNVSTTNSNNNSAKPSVLATTTVNTNSNLTSTPASTTINANAAGLTDDDWCDNIEKAKLKMRNIIKRKSEEIANLQKQLRVLEQM